MYVISFFKTVYCRFFLPAISFFCFCSCSLDIEGTWSSRDGGENNPEIVDFDAETHQIDGLDADVEMPPPGCGNGVIEGSEECDDGANGDDTDGCTDNCEYSCHGDDECRDANICNGEETCNTETHICEDGTPKEDGFVCSDDPRSICLGGACRESQCGDGFVDEGGGEFCEPSLDLDCNDDCTYTCINDDYCPDDGEDCNGEEYCNMDSHRCARRNPLPDGMECGDTPDVREICISGTCQESICGDEFIDPGADPAEECDDGNDIDGDGCDNDCAYSCHNSGECDDGELCNGDEWCDTTGTHMCRPGTNVDAGVPCNDNRFCTLTDECDGSGNCVGTGDACDDGISCTTDSCDEGSDSCTNTIDPGYCLIDGTCYTDGTENPSNECRECRVSVSSTSWTQKADMTDCTGGKCCEGICRADALCCSNTDCPPPECLGTADACDTFSDQSTCDNQEGCYWYKEGECNSGTYDCSDIGVRWICLWSCGCSWNWSDGSCEGGEKSCSTLTARDDCENCSCTWTWITRECRGTHPDCSTYTRSRKCNRQIDCDWKTYICQDYTCQ